MALGRDGTGEEDDYAKPGGEGPILGKKRDFLSSVELCVVDACECIGMGNWQHLVDGESWLFIYLFVYLFVFLSIFLSNQLTYLPLLSVLSALNHTPGGSRGVDFSRVRQWALQGD